MDGLAALKAIRELDPNARVVMASAMGQQSMIVEALGLGAKEFLIKPFLPDKVVDAVGRVLAA